MPIHSTTSMTNPMPIRLPAPRALREQLARIVPLHRLLAT
jgi:hypothetical protein